jgi:SAM-dependent methyltransferase
MRGGSPAQCGQCCSGRTDVSEMLFDAPFYQAINEARWGALQRMLTIAEAQIGPIRSVNDMGAGPGWFAARLTEAGRDVFALEGRANLVDVARERAPRARVEVFDFDASAIDAVPPPADAVLCFGLLYHVENPLRTLRMCRAMARRVVFLESMTVPKEGPVGRVVPENPNETQGMRPLALLLSPDAIAHALHASGFSRVYRVDGASIGHDDFVGTESRRKRRDMFLACDVTVEAPDLTEFHPAPLHRYQY